MELVDDDVVELLGIKLSKSRGDGLDTCEHDLGVRVFLLGVEETEISVRLHSPEYVAALAQDFLAMGNEEDPAVLRTRGVERGQPGLSESCCQHHETRGIPVNPSPFQSRQCLLLDLARRHRFRNRLQGDVDEIDHLGTIWKLRARAFLVVE